MIGSKKKVRLMREAFLAKGWATAGQFDRVHAPVGLDIGSKTVEEIAVSIAAQLVQVRHLKYAGKTLHITGIILAAGESTRMGKPKLFLPFGDKSMIEKVVLNAQWSVLDTIIVVAGQEKDRMQNILQGYPVEIVQNNRYRDGMLSSVHCGLEAVPGITDAVMVLLGDQPMISHAVIDGLIEVYSRSDKGIVLAAYDGQRGHPLLFGRKYMEEIMGFLPDMSLKDLLRKHPDEIEEMESGQVEILMDIDNEQEYTEALKHQDKND
jgi:molybdenum cofactor cytidylyltransferase